MARKHNLDKVSNHIMLETDLSEKDRDKLLDVVEAQINQNNDDQRRKELAEKSKRDVCRLQGKIALSKTNNISCLSLVVGFFKTKNEVVI